MARSRINRLRAWLILLPALLLLAVVYWVSITVEPPPQKINGKQRHDPDFFVENFSATTLTEQGIPRFTVSAAKMLHYPDDDSTHLENIQLVSVQPDRPTLRIFALNGTLSDKSEEVFLRDHVQIIREDPKKQNDMKLTTTFLHVIPDLNIAKTDQAVTLVDGNNTVHAVGMTLDHNARTINLLNQVRSEHAPVKK
ncbi:MAG: LPS export ABC transporter periplasmic protein LptC [Candidatus Nitrotoga sp.]